MEKDTGIKDFIDKVEKDEAEYLLVTVEPGEKVDSIEVFFSVKSNQSKHSLKQALEKVLDTLNSNDWKNIDK